MMKPIWNGINRFVCDTAEPNGYGIINTFSSIALF